MTMSEYHYYSDIARKCFEYMNGRINTMNSQCVLYIDMYDNINGTYANIRYPNFIFLHVGTIIDSWQDNWHYAVDKIDYICTCIAWAIAHELHHADQLISMLQYNHNPTYKAKVEGDVEYASYHWVGRNAAALREYCGFNPIIYDIESNSLPETGNYKKASIEQFYLQTIKNIVLRDENCYNACKCFTDDTVTDIELFFLVEGTSQMESIVIKSSGAYLAENINIFGDIAYRFAGYYDIYHVRAEVEFLLFKDNPNRKLAKVYLKISDPLVRPMYFKEGKGL